MKHGKKKKKKKILSFKLFHDKQITFYTATFCLLIDHSLYLYSLNVLKQYCTLINTLISWILGY